jgi:hypothetical protein
MYVYYVYIAHVHICAYVCGLSQGQLVTFRKDGNRIAAGEPLNLRVVESEIFWGAASRERQRFHELSQQNPANRFNRCDTRAWFPIFTTLIACNILQQRTTRFHMILL